MKRLLTLALIMTGCSKTALTPAVAPDPAPIAQAVAPAKPAPFRVPPPQVAIAGRWVRELCSGNESDPQMGISAWQRVQFVGTPDSYAMLVFEIYTRKQGNRKLKSPLVWKSNAEMSSQQDAWTLEDPTKASTDDNLLVIQRGSTLGSKLLVAGKPTPFLMGVEALRYSVFLPDDGVELEDYQDGCWALSQKEFR